MMSPKDFSIQERKKTHYCEHYDFRLTACNRPAMKVKITFIPDLRVVNCKSCAKKIKRKREIGKVWSNSMMRRIFP